MSVSTDIDGIAGALRDLASQLEPEEYAAHYYAARDIAEALALLTTAARSMREAEMLRTANAFGGGSDV